MAQAYAAAGGDEVGAWVDRLTHALSDTPDDHGRARLLLARAAVSPVDRPVAGPLADADEAAARFDAVGDAAGLARAAVLGAGLVVTLDDVQAVVERTVRALVAVEQVHDDELAADVLNELGVVFHRLGAHHRALELYERSGAAARRVASRWRVERSEHNGIETLLAAVRLDRLIGAPGDHEARLGRAEGLARELGSSVDTAAYLSEGPRMLADVLCEQGRPEEAWLTLVSQTPPSPDDDTFVAWRLVEARCLRLLGQPARALAALADAVEFGAGRTEEAEALFLLDERARARADAGDLVGAVDDTRRVVALVWDRSHRRTERAVDRLGALAEAEMGRRHLSRSAEVDPLTDVGNQLALDQRLDRSGDRPSVAVLVVDVDGFGALNERHGRDVGDEVLGTVAALVRQQLRDGDLVARAGGDEFVVVLDGLDLAAADAVAGRIRAAMTGHDWSAWAPGLTVSVAVGAAAGPGRDARHLVNRADLVLFEAKRSGRARVAS